MSHEESEEGLCGTLVASDDGDVALKAVSPVEDLRCYHAITSTGRRADPGRNEHGRMAGEKCKGGKTVPCESLALYTAALRYI